MKTQEEILDRVNELRSRNDGGLRIRILANFLKYEYAKSLFSDELKEQNIPQEQWYAWPSPIYVLPQYLPGLLEFLDKNQGFDLYVTLVEMECFLWVIDDEDVYNDFMSSVDARSKIEVIQKFLGEIK